MGTRLYVGNLSFDTTEAGIRDAFTSCGGVSEVKLVTDRETGRSRGFGFVTMADESAAATAISQMNGVNLDGRVLRVNEAEPRPERNGGGRSGGGGGGGGRGRDRW